MPKTGSADPGRHASSFVLRPRRNRNRSWFGIRVNTSDLSLGQALPEVPMNIRMRALQWRFLPMWLPIRFERGSQDLVAADGDDFFIASAGVSGKVPELQVEACTPSADTCGWQEPADASDMPGLPLPIMN